MPSCARCSTSSRERIGRARGGDPAGDGRARPQRRQERDHRDPPGSRRRRGRAVGRRPVPDAHPLRRAARLQGRAAGDRRGQLHVRDQGRRGLLGVQVRGRHAPRPARPRDRVPGPDPHLDRDRRRAARGRGGGGGDRRQRPADRRLPVLGPGRPVGQHDRLGGPDHPQAVRASSSRCRTRSPSCRTASARCGCCARASTSGRSPSSRPRSPPRAWRRSARASAPRRSAPTTTASAGSRTTGSTCSSHNLDGILMGELDELTDALQDDEKRRRLEEHGRLSSRRSSLGDAVSRRASTLAAAGVRLAPAGCRAAARRRARASMRARLVLDAGRAADRRQRGALRGAARPAGRRASRSPTSSGASRSGGSTLAVDARVLIPRPETELLVEVAAGAAGGLRALPDVGTGSGAVALALKRRAARPDVRGIDVSEDALAVARANARAARARGACARRSRPARRRSAYDAVLANLPYVADGAALAPEIARYEPAGALFAGADGLDLIRRLVRSGRSRPRSSWCSRSRSGSTRPMRSPTCWRDAGFGEVERSARSGRVRAGGRRAPMSGRRGCGRSSGASRGGGVALFPSDTVYGLACSPEDPVAVERLYASSAGGRQALGGDVLRPRRSL